MGQRAGQVYPAEGLRRLAGLVGGGTRIELEDRSAWEVSPGDEIYTSHWEPNETLVVVSGGVSDEYPYDLINPSAGERVAARFRGFDREEEPTGWTFAAD